MDGGRDAQAIQDHHIRFRGTNSVPVQRTSGREDSRIGVLLLNDSQGGPIEAFRQGLNDLGYVEGHTIFIERRSAKGNPERLSQMAAELVAKKVNLIVTAGTAQAQAIRQASTTIPIVLAISGDPVATGLAASLARPGENVTGLSMISPELSEND